MKKKLAIVTTHPIQYNAPVFQLLAARKKVAIKVFYTWSQAQAGVYDPGFGKQRQWDIPLLEGYDYCFVRNTAKDPGSHHFRGIKNPGLVQAIEDWQPDAVLVFGWSFRSHLRCLRYFKNRLPVFFRGDSTLLDERGGVRTLLRRRFLTWVYRHVDKVFYVGTNNKRYFQRHGIKEEQLVSTPHAIDNDRFSPAAGKAGAARIRTALRLQPNDFLVLFAGKLEGKKNPFFLLELASRIPDQEVHFLFVGNGELESRLKAAARDDARIHFMDFQNQSVMPSVYRAADCFILPSRGPGETWGLAANEAMACGLPILLSDKAGGAPDLVQGNGLIFQTDQPDRVALYLQDLKANADLLSITKQRSLEHSNKFRMESIAAALEEQLL